MSYSDEKDIAVSIDDEKHTVRKSIASTSDSFDQSTLFSDDATIRADSTSASHSPRSQNAHRRKSSTSARFSSASAIPNAFALSRSCSPSGVVKSNHNSIMGAITGFAISRTGRFLRFLGLKSSCIRQRNVVRDWMRELDMLLNAPPEELLKSQGKLAQTLDDLLTITTTVPDVKGKSNEKDEQLLLSLMMRTIDSDWIKAITKYSYNTGQDGCIVVLVDYLCRLYRTQDADVILQKILHGILDCSTVHLAISSLLAPKFIRENVLPVLCEIVSRRPEVFALEDVVGFHRDCLLLKLSSILYSCELTADFVTICGQDRLMLFIDAVSGDEYCTISKEFVVVSSFAAFAKYSPAVRQRLSDLASMSMFVSTLQISTLNVYGRAVSWDILLEVDGLSDKICEAAILLLRTLFNRNDQLWAKDDLFLGNLSRLIKNENFKKKFIEFGAVSSVLMSLEPLQGNHISLEAPSQPKRAVASLLMLLLRLDPDVMRRLTDGWFKGLDTQDGKITIGSFDLEVFCWATALFAVSVEFYPELAVYPERKDAIKRLVNGCRACNSPWGKEKYTLALELCWESVYGKPKLKELGLTEYDVMLGMHELKQC